MPLSRNGHDELRDLEHRLRDTPPFDAIYSSPLRRARETAVVLERAGLGMVQVCPSLKEIDCGVLDGMPLDQVRWRYPELWEMNQGQVDDEFRWPGGESYREFRSRCLAAVRTLAQRHPGGRIAVVTHAGVISQVIGFLAGTGPAEWERYRPVHAALTEMEWERGRGTVVRFDDGATFQFNPRRRLPASAP